MIQFATYAEMRGWAQLPRTINFSKQASVLSGKTVFLSHASADNDLVPGAVLILENHGGRVYVDNRDPSLPGSDCVAIADHLRQVIKKTRQFVMLATPRSKDSKWIPWELGLGDGIHGERDVVLFPSAETWHETQWSEREYLGLYKRIVYGDHTSHPDKKIWMVINPRTFEAIPLEDWIRN